QENCLNETQKKLDINEAVVRKETTIIAQQASIDESESSLTNPQSKKGVILTPASAAGVTTASSTVVTDTDADRGGAMDDTYATEDDELAPDLTNAMPQHGDKSSPFYELINYVFQKAKGMAAILPTTTPNGISALHHEMHMIAAEELKRPGPVFLKKDVLSTPKEHLRRLAIDVKDVLAMSVQTPFGSNSDEDTDDNYIVGTTSIDVPERCRTPPPKKRLNPYILFSPSKRDRRSAQNYIDFVDDDEDDD
ncbi:hypothetical protein FBU30_010960, partial [Linnemannia zychae]